MIEVDPVRLPLQQPGQHLGRGLRLHGAEQFDALGAGPTPRRAVGIDDLTAGDGAPRRLVAEDEVVPVHRLGALIEDHLHQAALARVDRAALEHRYPPGERRRSEVHVHRRPVAQRPVLGGEHQDLGVDAPGGLGRGIAQQPVPAVDLRPVQISAGEVERAALAHVANLGALVLGVYTADPHPGPPPGRGRADRRPRPRRRTPRR